MGSNNHVAPIDEAQIPLEEEAVRLFEEDGGTLTLWSPFGVDPLAHSSTLIAQREAEFHRNIPDISVAFHKLVNGDTSIFCRAIQSFVHITESLM